jgi:hypothetical protein
MRIKLLDHVNISRLVKKTAEMPPKEKWGQSWENVLTTPTEVEIPLETTPGRTVRKARLRRNSREWPFFVFT